MDFKTELYSFLFVSKNNDAHRFIRALEDCADMYFVGGILREYKDKGYIQDVKDIDIVISIKDRNKFKQIGHEYNHYWNRFEGFKFEIDGLMFDVWEIQNTWAYREKKIVCNKENYVENLPQTVFLNLDAIVYDWKNDIWYDEIYNQAMEIKILDIILADNPAMDSSVLHTILMKKKYGMQYSEKLLSVIKNKYNSLESIDLLWHSQFNRYKEEVLTRAEIEMELFGVE